jgi:hypothetical protein
MRSPQAHGDDCTRADTALKLEIIGVGRAARTYYPLNFEAGTVALDESYNQTSPAGHERGIADICL